SAAGHVLRQGEVGRDLHLEAEAGGADRGGEHGGGTGHVGGHVVHAGGGLERDAAGVEGDSLADQGDRARGGGGGVLEAHQAGRTGRALAHADDAAVAALCELLLVEDGDGDGEVAHE